MHRFRAEPPLAPLASPLLDENIEKEEAPPTVGDRVCFFDANRSYQDVHYAKLWGEIIEAGPTVVRLRLDDGKVTNYLRRSWIFVENEPVRNQMQELVDDLLDGAA